MRDLVLQLLKPIRNLGDRCRILLIEGRGSHGLVDVGDFGFCSLDFPGNSASSLVSLKESLTLVFVSTLAAVEEVLFEDVGNGSRLLALLALVTRDG